MAKTVFSENAKEMAVKEKKYDLDYEAVHGGAYCDRAPYESEQCHFSSNGSTTDPQCCEGSSFGEVPNEQQMTQSFVDQISEFGAVLTREEEGIGT